MRYDQAFRREGYHTALLTTFSFDPTVFENVILVAMRSRGCRNIGILADRDMVNKTLSEIAPAPRAGTAYHLAKTSVAGAFHPKIVLQLGQTESRLMVGSPNLTGAGLVGNLETVSTVIVNEESQSGMPLLAEAFRYFERHTDKNDRAMRDVLARARARSPWLANTEPSEEVIIGAERIALLTESENAGIGDRFQNFVGDDLIHQLVIVSPYADKTLAGFSQLRAAFGTPATSFVVDPYEQDFTAETFEAQTGVGLFSSEPHEWGGERRLHAKVIIACGSRADYVLSGSANASTAGLFSRIGGAGNAEAAIARTEPAGTAIDRLKLSDCLSAPMPLSMLSLRHRARSGTEVDHQVPPDGGGCWIEHGFIFWRPPTSSVPAECLLRLMDGTGAEIAVSSPVAEDDYFSLPLDADAGTPRIAVVVFPNGRESAPMPIAALNRLQTNANPPRTGAGGRILAELEGRDDIDVEDYERAMKLLALIRPDENRKRDVARRTDEKEEDEEGKILPENEFGELAKTPEGRQDLKTGPISEMRRLVNAFLGLGTLASADVEDLDPLANHIRNANTTDRATSDGNGTDEGNHNTSGGHDGDSGGNTNSAKPRQSKQPKRSKSKANAGADKLVKHVDVTCRALARPDLDPLNLESAIRIHLLINVFLSHCAPVGEKATVRYPIVAIELPRSWIRILGRLIVALEVALERTAANTSEEDLEEECIEALATILFCASLLLDAAQISEMPPAVVDKLESANASLARSIAMIVAGKPMADAAIRQKFLVLTAKHRLVPGNAN